MFYSLNPNIFQLIDILKQVQCDIYVKICSSNLNNRRGEILDKEKCTSSAMTEFQNEIHIIKYIEKLAYMALPIVK
jgi:hypothetical protein